STTGVCRPYCCASLDDCAKETFCHPEAMAEAMFKPVLIPVCIPETHCQLLDDSTCPTGLTCTVVRDDGTTSCVQPGSHKRGEPCPCAPGYVCSTFDNECTKLCHVGGNDCDPGGTCTGGIYGYPSDIGLCEGYSN